MGAFVTRVSLETFIRKGKITEGTNLESQHLVPTSLQFLPGPRTPLPAGPLVSQHTAWVVPWVCWLADGKALGSSMLHWKQNTLSLPQPLHQAGPIQDQGPLSPREQGLFICFVHHHHPSPQKSGWHIIGSLQIFIRWWMNDLTPLALCTLLSSILGGQADPCCCAIERTMFCVLSEDSPQPRVNIRMIPGV